MEPLIECADLLHRLGDDELVVVDCRDPEAWETQPFHIPGALRMTLADLCEAAHILPDDELIVLCGIHLDNSDARRAYRVLRVRNRDAVCLNGGLEAWQREGFPTEPVRRAAEEQQDERADRAG